jgi:hypothetical protein
MKIYGLILLILISVSVIGCVSTPNADTANPGAISHLINKSVLKANEIDPNATLSNVHSSYSYVVAIGTMATVDIVMTSNEHEIFIGMTNSESRGDNLEYIIIKKINSSVQF